MFQSTRPRGARQHAVWLQRSSIEVSIHAPARGATCARGIRVSHTASFNPRARVGRDAGDRRRSVRLHHVSIHAPARGATSHRRHRVHANSSFNPRARAGRDALGPAGSARSCCFNPRARAGRDGAVALVNGSLTAVSIHAPARGATHALVTVESSACLFQSTRPRGARRARKLQRAIEHCRFQSTRPRGARRRDRERVRCRACVFQSTRPRGARRHGATCRQQIN